MNDLNLGPRAPTESAPKSSATQRQLPPPRRPGHLRHALRMGQEWNMRYPLVVARQLCSIDADPPAAMRYTEREWAPAMEMMADINYDTVDFIPNYDETEPSVVLLAISNLLATARRHPGRQWRRNIPPAQPPEVCDALLLVIDDPKCGFKEIMKVLPVGFPDRRHQSAARRDHRRLYHGVATYCAGKAKSSPIKRAKRDVIRKSRIRSSRRPSSRRSRTASTWFAAEVADVRDESPPGFAIGSRSRRTPTQRSR